MDDYQKLIIRRVTSNRIQSIREKFYQTTGYIDSESREQEVVKPRAALTCALSCHFTITSISNAFNQNHTTLIYHRRKHEANMEHWQGYKQLFEISLQIIESMPYIKSTCPPSNPAKSFNEWQEFLLAERRKMFANNLRTSQRIEEMANFVDEQDVKDKANLLDAMLKEIREGKDITEAAKKTIEDAINYGFTQ